VTDGTPVLGTAVPRTTPCSASAVDSLVLSDAAQPVESHAAALQIAYTFFNMFKPSKRNAIPAWIGVSI
jgi:hypothetical protein